MGGFRRRSSIKKRAANKKKRGFSIESLEPRLLLDASPFVDVAHVEDNVGTRFNAIAREVQLVDSSSAANGNNGDVVVSGTSGDDNVTITTATDGKIEIVNETTMETVLLDTSTLNSLTIDGGDGRDNITIAGDIDLPGIDLLVNAEEINVESGVVVSTFDNNTNSYGDITFNAFDSSTDSEKANADVQITIDSGSLVGGDVTLSSVSEINAINTGNEVFSELNAGRIIGNSSAVVSVLGNSSIESKSDSDSAGNLTIKSGSTVNTTLSVVSRTTGTLGVDIAAAASIVDSTSIAEVKGTSTLAASGSVNISAENETSVTTTTDGTAGGSIIPAGTAANYSRVTEVTKAYVEGRAAVTDSDSVTISASANNSHVNSAVATPNGASAGTKTAQALLDSLINSVNSSITTFNSTFGTPISLIPSVALPTIPAGNVSVASALALGKVESTTESYVNTDSLINSRGGVLIQTLNDTDSQTSADASTVDGSNLNKEIGSALAINNTDVNSTAYLAGATTIQGDSVTVSSDMLNGNGTDATHTTGATATSGAGASDVGVAGSFALNSANLNNSARIKTGSDITLTGTPDITLQADTTTYSNLESKPEAGAGQDGVGAGVGLNIVRTSSNAIVEDGAVLSGANNLSVLADSNDSIATTVAAGAQGSTSTTPAVAISVLNSDGNAFVGAGAEIDLAGALLVEAQQSGDSSVIANGSSIGSTGATGTTMALGVTDANANATVNRKLSTAGAVEISALTDRNSSTQASAGTVGAQSADDKADALLSTYNTFLSSEYGVDLGTLPAIKTPDGDALAAALALNIDGSDSTALINLDGEVSSDTSVVVKAAGDVDSTSGADTIAVAGDAKGMAVALNISNPDTLAGIKGDVRAPVVLVNSSSTGDGVNSSSATATSGANGTEDTFAGTLAMNIASSDVSSIVDGNATVTLTGTDGQLDVSASQSTNDTVIADTAAVGTNGIGGSVGVNIVNNSTNATIKNGATITNAEDISVNATGTYNLSNSVQSGAISDDSLSGAIGFAYSGNETRAAVEGGASAISVAGDMLVYANHTSAVTSTVSGDTVGTADAIHGVAVNSTIVGDSSEAYLGRSVTSGGNVTVSSTMKTDTAVNTAAAVAGVKDVTGRSAQEEVARVFGTYDPTLNDADGVYSNVVLPTVTEQSADDAVNPAKMGAAAALSVNVDNTSNDAAIGDNLVLNVGKTVTVTTISENDIIVKTDAASVNSDVSEGVTVETIGAAITINHAGADNRAELGSSTITAENVVVENSTAVGEANNISIQSISGVGAEQVGVNTGVAGSLVVSTGGIDNEAVVATGANITLSGTAGTLNVLSNTITNTDNSAIATSIGDLGVGASVLISAMTSKSTAAIEDNVTVTNAQDVLVNAEGTYVTSNVANSGAIGTKAPAGAIFIGGTGSDTIAKVGTSTDIAVSNDLIVNASSDSVTNVLVDGESSGAGVAGVGLGILLSNDETSATLSGNVIAGNNVEVSSRAIADSVLVVRAGAMGAPETGRDANTLLKDLELENVPLLQDVIDQYTTDAGVGPALAGAAATIAVNNSFSDNSATIGSGASITADKLISVNALDDTDIVTVSDSSAVDSLVSAGLAVGSNAIYTNNTATVEAASLHANDIVVNSQNITGERNETSVSAIMGAGNDVAGFAGAIGVNSGVSIREAKIAGNATVVADNDLAVLADSDHLITENVGNTVEGGLAGVGIGLGINAVSTVTLATVGEENSVDATKTKLDAAGKLVVQATSSDEVITSVVGGQSSALASVASSIAITAPISTTRAETHGDAEINKTTGLVAKSDQSVTIAAASDTTVQTFSGTNPEATVIGAGASVDVGIMHKETGAVAGGDITAKSNIVVDAVSVEDIDAASAGTPDSSVLSISGAGAVYLISPITQAAIAENAIVEADNVIVSADDLLSVDVNAGAGDATWLASVGTATAAPVITKTTQAFVGAGAKVTTYGMNEVSAKTGTFTVSYVDDIDSPTEVSAPSGLSVVSILEKVTDLENISNDGSVKKQRVSTPDEATIRGLSVTALSRDDVEISTRGATAALLGAAGLSISSGILNSQTSAYIAANAEVNTGTTGEHSDQEVTVVAASDSYFMGKAGVMSASVANVAPALQFAHIGNTTESYIGKGATVHAKKNIIVSANAVEDIMGLAGGLTAGYFNLGASIPVVSVHSATAAHIDGTVLAEGSVVVTADSFTDSDLYSGSFALGLTASVETSFGVSLINKNTEAFIGSDAVVDGLANHADSVLRSNGEEVKGVLVEATSKEDIKNLVGSAGAAYGINLSGTVGATVVTTMTKAYIEGADVNLDKANSNAAQQLVISSKNDIDVLGVSINAGATYGLNVALGADIGFIRNDTLAFIGAGANAYAKDQIRIIADTDNTVHSFVGGLSATAGVGLRGSVSMYTIGNRVTLPATTPSESDIQNALSDAFGSVESAMEGIQAEIDGQTTSLSNEIAGGLNAYLGGVGSLSGVTGAAAKAIEDNAPNNPLSSAIEDPTLSGGTAAYIDGAESVEAGNTIDIKADVSTNAVLDTSKNFTVDITGISFSVDAGLLNNYSSSRAFIANSAAVTATETVSLTALQNTNSEVIGTVSLNTTGTETAAYLDSSTVNSKVFTVNATNSGEAKYVSFVPGWSGLTYKVAYSEMNNIVDTHISNSTVNVSESVTLKALNTATVEVVAAVTNYAKQVWKLEGSKFGFGASMAYNSSQNQTRSYIDSSAVTTKTLTVEAIQSGKMNTFVSGVQAAEWAALGASCSLNSAKDVTEAYISGDTSKVVSAETISVKAIDNSLIKTFAGAFGYANVSIGAAVAKNDVESTTKTYIKGAKVQSTAGDIELIAESNQRIFATTLGGAGGKVTVAGSASQNTLSGSTEAYITDGADVDSVAELLVNAIDNSEIDAIAGQGSASKVAIGAGMAQNTAKNSIKAYIAGADTKVDGENVTVLAEANSSILTIAFGGTGADHFALGGSVALNTLSSSTEAFISEGAEAVAQVKLSVKANDTGTIESFAGQGTGSTATIGGAVATNKIANSLKAYVTGVDTTATANVTNIIADSAPAIGTLSIGGAASQTVTIGGAASLNEISNTVEAFVSDKATIIGTESVLITAKDRADLTSTAGGFTGSGVVAIGGAAASNKIGNTIKAYVKDSGTSVTSDNGSVTVKAVTAPLLSTRSIGGGFSEYVTVNGAASINEITGSAEATVSDGAVVTGDKDVSILAADNSMISSFAGNVSGSGVVALGASAADNKITGTVKALVTGSDTKITSMAGTANVHAESHRDIRTLSIGGGVSSYVSISGAASLNDIAGTIEAVVSDEADVTGENGVSILADDNSSVSSIAGNGSGSQVVSMGASAAYNHMHSTVHAEVNNAKVKADSGNVLVNSRGVSEIGTISIGGAGAGIVGLAGSASINKMGNSVTTLIDNGNIEADGSVIVGAESKNTIETIAGVGAGGVAGLAGGISINTISNTTTAEAKESTLKAAGNLAEVDSVKGVGVLADSSETIRTLTTAGAGGTVGISGSTTINKVNDITSAKITDSTTNDRFEKGGDVKVNAQHSTDLGAASVTGAGGVVGLGLAIESNNVANTTTATISGDKTAVYSGTGVDVKAVSREKVNSVGMTATGGVVGVNGNVKVVKFASTTEAYIDSVAGTNSGIYSDKDIVVTADSSTNFELITGSFSGGFVSVGGSVVLADINNSTFAYISNSETNAKLNTIVDAKSNDTIHSLALTGTGGFVAVNGAVATNTITSDTQAYITSSHINQDTGFTGDSENQNVTVTATEISTISGIAGGASGGFVGVGSAVNVSTIKSGSKAFITGNSIVSANGNIVVDANSNRNLTMHTYAFAGGFVGVSGAVSVGSVGGGISVDGKTAANTDGFGGDEGDKQTVNELVTLEKGVDGLADGFASDVNDEIKTPFSMDDGLSTTSSASSTTAYIDHGTTVTAGKNVKVKADGTIVTDVNAGGVSGGFVGVGVGVNHLKVDSDVSATIGGTVHAGESVLVYGHLNESINQMGISGGTGFVTVNVNVCKVVNDSSVFAGVLPYKEVEVSPGNTIEYKTAINADNVTVNADRDLFLSTDLAKGSGGVIGVGTSVISVEIGDKEDGKTEVEANIGDQAEISANSVHLRADNTDAIRTSLSAASVEGISVQVSTSKIENNNDAIASVGDSVLIGQNIVDKEITGVAETVNIEAESHHSSRSSLNSLSVSGVSVPVLLSSIEETSDSNVVIGTSTKISAKGIGILAANNFDTNSSNHKTIEAHSAAVASVNVNRSRVNIGEFDEENDKKHGSDSDNKFSADVTIGSGTNIHGNSSIDEARSVKISSLKRITVDDEVVAIGNTAIGNVANAKSIVRVNTSGKITLNDNSAVTNNAGEVAISSVTVTDIHNKSQVTTNSLFTGVGLANTVSTVNSNDIITVDGADIKARKIRLLTGKSSNENVDGAHISRHNTYARAYAVLNSPLPSLGIGSVDSHIIENSMIDLKNGAKLNSSGNIELFAAKGMLTGKWKTEKSIGFGTGIGDSDDVSTSDSSYDVSIGADVKVDAGVNNKTTIRILQRNGYKKFGQPLYQHDIDEINARRTGQEALKAEDFPDIPDFNDLNRDQGIKYTAEKLEIAEIGFELKKGMYIRCKDGFGTGTAEVYYEYTGNDTKVILEKVDFTSGNWRHEGTQLDPALDTSGGVYDSDIMASLRASISGSFMVIKPEGIDAPTLTYDNMANMLIEQKNNLEAWITAHDTDQKAKARYNAELEVVKMQLAALGAEVTSEVELDDGTIETVTVYKDTIDSLVVKFDDIYTSPGSVFITVTGQSENAYADKGITAGAGALIDISNETATTMSFKNISMKDNKTTYVGADNRVQELDGGYVYVNGIQIVSSDLKNEGLIRITENTPYNVSDGKVTFNEIDFNPVMDVIVNGQVLNEAGTVEITNNVETGNITIYGDVSAKEQKIGSRGDLTINSKGWARTGSDPRLMSDDLYSTLEANGTLTSTGVFDDQSHVHKEGAGEDVPTLSAEGNIAIIAKHLNLNGTIKSGVSKAVLKINNSIDVSRNYTLTSDTTGVTEIEGVTARVKDGQIIVDNIVPRGGKVMVAGQIFNTNPDADKGGIKVASGYTDLDIQNDSEHDLVLNKIDTSIEKTGEITIVDTLKELTTNYLVTSNKVVETVRDFDGEIVGQAIDHGIDADIKYETEDHLYYTWTEGQRSVISEFSRYEHKIQKFFGFETALGDWWEDDESRVDHWETPIDDEKMLESSSLIDYADNGEIKTDLLTGLQKDDGSFYDYFGTFKEVPNELIVINESTLVKRVTFEHKGSDGVTRSYNGDNKVYKYTGEFDDSGEVSLLFRDEMYDQAAFEAKVAAGEWTEATEEETNSFNKDNQNHFESKFANRTVTPKQGVDDPGGWFSDKTYWTEVTIEKGIKDYYTHSLNASNDVNIDIDQNLGASAVNIKTNGNLILTGEVKTPDDCTLTLNSENGSITTTGGVTFIGSTPNLNVDGDVTISVAASAGDINIKATGDITINALSEGDESTPLTIGEVASSGGNVVINAPFGIIAKDEASIVSGNRVEINAKGGAIGGDTPLRIDTSFEDEGGFAAIASGDISIVETDGDLYLINPEAWDDDIAVSSADGSVTIQTENGSIYNRLRNDAELSDEMKELILDQASDADRPKIEKMLQYPMGSDVMSQVFPHNGLVSDVEASRAVDVKGRNITLRTSLNGHIGRMMAEPLSIDLSVGYENLHESELSMLSGIVASDIVGVQHSMYRYVGTAGNSVDLGTADYTDTSLWEKVTVDYVSSCSRGVAQDIAITTGDTVLVQYSKEEFGLYEFNGVASTVNIANENFFNSTRWTKVNSAASSEDGTQLLNQGDLISDRHSPERIAIRMTQGIGVDASEMIVTDGGASVNLESTTDMKIGHIIAMGDVALESGGSIIDTHAMTGAISTLGTVHLTAENSIGGIDGIGSFNMRCGETKAVTLRAGNIANVKMVAGDYTVRDVTSATTGMIVNRAIAGNSIALETEVGNLSVNSVMATNEISLTAAGSILDVTADNNGIIANVDTGDVHDDSTGTVTLTAGDSIGVWDNFLDIRSTTLSSVSENNTYINSIDTLYIESAVSVNGDIIFRSSEDIFASYIEANNGTAAVDVVGSILNNRDDSSAVITAGSIVLNAETGTIGTAEKNFAIDSENGTLTAEAAEEVSIIEIDGDMNINSVISENAEVTLTASGSLVDANNSFDLGLEHFGLDDLNISSPVNDLNVAATTIHLISTEGGIGTLVDAIEIDVYGERVGRIHARAEGDISIDEIVGSMNTGTITSNNGTASVGTRDTAIADEDVFLDAESSVTALKGNVIIRAADSLYHLTGAMIMAGDTIFMYGDWGNADAGIGSEMIINGTISAGLIKISGEDDSDTILLDVKGDNTVSGRVEVYGGKGDDTITAVNLDTEQIHLLGEEDNDIINAVEMNNRVHIYGGTGDDTIDGGQAGDIIFGGADNDTISGGAGTDFIFGDGGQVLDGAKVTLSVVESTGQDSISGNTGDDVVLGDNGIVSTDALYDSENSIEKLIAVDNNLSTMGDNDEITSGDGDDIIIGGAGTDTVNSGAGDDIVIGDKGTTTFEMLAGISTVASISVDSDTDGAGDIITSGSGNDVVIAGRGDDTIDSGSDTGADIVLGDSGTVTYNSGNLLNVYADSTTAGADVITTGGGKDLVIGGLGDDTITAIDGNDIVIGDNGQIRFDTITGSSVIKQISNLGEMTGGNDTISTGNGDDIIVGGLGSDTIKSGTDDGQDTVLGDTGVITFSNGEQEHIQGHGNSGGDDIIETFGGDDIVIAGLGNDEITSGSGDDIVLGDNGILEYLRIGEEFVINRIVDNEPLLGGNDTIVTGSGEDVIVGGLGDDGIASGTEDDTVLGDTGEVLYSSGIISSITGFGTLGGIDIISTDTGDDVVVAGLGNDTVSTDAGADVVIGDNGSVLFETVEGSTTIATITNETEAAGGDDIITTSAGEDIVLGGLGSDEVNGGIDSDIVLGDNGTVSYNEGILTSIIGSGTVGGNDTIATESGDDVVVAGLGNDTVSTDAGADVVIGDNGSVLYETVEVSTTIATITNETEAAGGDDIITTGAGEDIVLGGLGSDEVNSGIDSDIVLGDNGTVSYNEGILTSIIGSGTVGGNDTIVTESGDDVVVAGLGNDTVSTDTGADVVIGDNGSVLYETVEGSTAIAIISNKGELDGGDDIIHTGAGDDVIVAGLGNDIVDSGNGNDADILLGDNGTVEYEESRLTTVYSEDYSHGGNDQLVSGDGDDVIIGGMGNDHINALRGTKEYAGEEDFGIDIAAGDNARVEFVLSEDGVNYVRTIKTSEHDLDVLTDSNFDTNGGDDVIFTGNGNDVVIGGVGKDHIDTGLGDDRDVVMGDNGRIHMELVNIPVDHGVTTKHLLLQEMTSVSLVHGDDDDIYTGNGDDAVIAGLGSDVVNADRETGLAVGSDDTGNDIVIGDNGRIFPTLATDPNGETVSVHQAHSYGLGEVAGSDDIINTFSGNDVVIGGQGSDTINVAGLGEDRDVVVGDDGVVNLVHRMTGYIDFSNDLHEVSGLSSVKDTGSNNDTIVAGLGSDVVIGGAGDDMIDVSAGDTAFNWVVGDNGRVSFAPGSGVLKAESFDETREIGGNDIIITDEGVDVAIGGLGDDHISTNGGTDYIIGDGGKIEYDGSSNTAVSLISNFGQTVGGIDTINAGTGSDYILSGLGNDIVHTGEDNDDDYLVQGNGSIFPQMDNYIQNEYNTGEDTVTDPVDYSDVVAWNSDDAWGTYQVGDLRTYNGKVFKVINIAYTENAPESEWGKYSWEEVAVL